MENVKKVKWNVFGLDILNESVRKTAIPSYVQDSSICRKLSGNEYDKTISDFNTSSISPLKQGCDFTYYGDTLNTFSNKYMWVETVFYIFL